MRAPMGAQLLDSLELGLHDRDVLRLFLMSDVRSPWRTRRVTVALVMHHVQVGGRGFISKTEFVAVFHRL
jgi:hypothetical protein